VLRPPSRGAPAGCKDLVFQQMQCVCRCFGGMGDGNLAQVPGVGQCLGLSNKAAPGVAVQTCLHAVQRAVCAHTP
jgi:hypothetical protein